MIRLEGLRLTRGDFALTCDLTVAAGAHLNLMGPSGAGKSTVLDAIAGFLSPDAGRVVIDGADVTAAPPAARPVTMLFQDHNLFPHLTAARNVALGLRPDLRLRPGDAEAVESALGAVGLGGLGERRPGDLSGGQRQRVALARALIRDKPVLLLDEPFAALGPAQRAEMIGLVAELRARRSAAVIMVTHAPDDAAAAGGATAVVAEGRVAPPAPTADLLADPPPALAAYLGARGTGRG